MSVCVPPLSSTRAPYNDGVVRRNCAINLSELFVLLLLLLLWVGPLLPRNATHEQNYVLDHADRIYHRGSRKPFRADLRRSRRRDGGGLLLLEFRQHAFHGVEQGVQSLVPGTADHSVSRLHLAGQRR